MHHADPPEPTGTAEPQARPEPAPMPGGVLPPDPWRRINDRWHGGAAITAEEVGELLNQTLALHLEVRRLLSETVVNLVTDPDAPHLLRDVARGCALEGQRNVAARLRTLANEVQAMLNGANTTGEKNG